jgi:hypothetical protein
VAELVDARDLKSPATIDRVTRSCKTASSASAVSASHRRILQNNFGAIFVASKPLTTRERARREVLIARTRSAPVSDERVDLLTKQLRSCARRYSLFSAIRPEN